MGIPLFSSVSATVAILCVLASLSPTECKNSTVPPEARIVSGENTAEREFPHQVYMRPEQGFWNTIWNGPTFCGGSILNADYILTAAHCVHQFHPSKISFGVGRHDTRDLVPSDWYTGAEVMIHPCYNKKADPARAYLYNDIAIVKLDKSLPLNGRNIKAIQIDEQNLAQTGTGTAVGWGMTTPTNDGSAPAVLQKVNVGVISDYCEASGTSYINLKPEGQICSYSATGASICGGDSGGPLLCDDRKRTNTSVVCGIVSGGLDVGKGECSASVFTRIFRYRGWIKSILNGTKYSVEGCVGEPLVSEDEYSTSRGSLSYHPNHAIYEISLTLIFLFFWGKKIFLNF